MKKIYLAAPFGKPDSNERAWAESAREILSRRGFDVHCPWETIIPHAWDYPNDEWGAMVFACDVDAINRADIVVVLSYGRESTAGTNWEAGYAYGIGKKVIVVEMTNKVMSLMVANGRWATLRGLSDLTSYDFDDMPKKRTKTEVK